MKAGAWSEYSEQQFHPADQNLDEKVERPELEHAC